MSDPRSFSLIVCTYRRPQVILNLLDSVAIQSRSPHEIIIVDGSEEDSTEKALKDKNYDDLRYFRVDAAHLGLTRQRNFGIRQVASEVDIVCFLDDDVVLQEGYFEQLITTYDKHPEALGVGGYITNDVVWTKSRSEKGIDDYCYDGYCRKDGSRFMLRKRLGLAPDRPPAHFPEFGHGRSVAFLPPSGKIYPAEQIMGGVSSFPKKVLDQHQFSTYFEGYGLYEDAEFTLRLSKIGKLYVNTAATLKHFHDSSGRPNQYRYGKMVIRNGWYVWRVKYPNPSLKARLKWHATAGLLTAIRYLNVVTTSERKKAFTEALGRTVGWCSLWFNPPRPS
ncbi:glycosyltransferase family 2 protein [Croceiramulus getboli]|nr:glycosyltransferase [Flavobacteriaceae bacterium YJPT1-3]